jgi:hypothetical protein
LCFIARVDGYLFFATALFFVGWADFFETDFFADFFFDFFAALGALAGLTTAMSFVPMGEPRPVQASQPGPALKPTGVPV